jgi:DNA-binding CsgD family transcriptional regulator
MQALASSDLAALRVALLVLLSPFDYPDTVAWRRAASGAIRACLGADSTYVTMPGRGARTMVGTGEMAPQALADYVAHYHRHNPCDAVRLRRHLSQWARESLVPRSELIHTEYFVDYCQPNDLQSSCGMSASLPGPGAYEAVVHVTSAHPGRFPAEGREVQLLSLLQPAFVAGVRSAILASTWQAELQRELDAGAAGIAVCDLRGRLLHATPKLLELVQADPDGSRILGCVTRVAADTGGLLARGEPAEPPGPRRAVHTRVGRYLVRASILRTPELLGQSSLVLLIVDPPPELSLPSKASLRAHFRLTDREADAALLLARGTRNRAIASAMGVTEHTARRHTERVLAKLAVTSRAEAAAILRGGGSTAQPEG